MKGRKGCAFSHLVSYMESKTEQTRTLRREISFERVGRGECTTASITTKKGKKTEKRRTIFFYPLGGGEPENERKKEKG